MGTLTFIGSGELGPSMIKVHRAIARRLATRARPVFVDTPAGFEPNVHDIARRAAAYVEKHLGVPCEVASYTGVAATPAEVEHALAVLLQANYIFAGPGSPSYAVRAWRDSPVLALMAQRLQDGAHLVCASAAAIALGAYALPVYEIFKAGAELHWLDGANLLGGAGLRLAVVPHWNNAEGGTYDTSCCFMGRDRFARLEALLDDDVAVLGVDEHTACTIDLDREACAVMGGGAVTIRRGGHERQFAAGSVFALDDLRSGRPAGASAAKRDARPAPQERPRTRLLRETERAQERSGSKPDGAQRAALAFALAGAIEECADAGVGEDALAPARAALADHVRAWCEALPDGAGGVTGETAPFVDLLVAMRSRLRSDGAWALSDMIRDGLSSLGVVVEDGPSGTTWRRREG